MVALTPMELDERVRKHVRPVRFGRGARLYRVKLQAQRSSRGLGLPQEVHGSGVSRIPDDSDNGDPGHGLFEQL